MTAPSYNVERYNTLLIAAEAAAAALPVLAETARNAAAVGRAERAEAERLSPFAPERTTVETLVAEHERLVADPDHNRDHASRVRAALAPLRRAEAAEARAAGLQAEADRRAAELRPLQALVLACKRYVGEDVIHLARPSR